MHFSVGLFAGTCAFLPVTIRRIRAGSRMASAVGILIAGAYLTALFAVIPNLARRAGVPEFICSGWWMNLFLLHPLMDHAKKGGMLVGEVLTVICFLVQYAIVLAAIARLRRPASTVT
jgi:hypothetical protein